MVRVKGNTRRCSVITGLTILIVANFEIANERPRIPRGGDAWLQENLADGKSRNKFTPGISNTGKLHVRAEDDGGKVTSEAATGPISCRSGRLAWEPSPALRCYDDRYANPAVVNDSPGDDVNRLTVKSNSYAREWTAIALTMVN